MFSIFNNCFILAADRTAMENFYWACQNLVYPETIDRDLYEASQIFAYKIYIMCVATPIVADPKKLELLTPLLRAVINSGCNKKIFHDALEAMEYAHISGRTVRPLMSVRKHVERYSQATEAHLFQDIRGFENLIT